MGSVFKHTVQAVEVFCLLVHVCLEDFHAEVVAELEEDFEKQAVEAQDIPLGPDVVGYLHLDQGVFEDIQLCPVDGVIAGIVQGKQQLLGVGGIGLYKIQGDLEDDGFVGRGAFCGVDDAGVHQKTLAGSQLMDCSPHCHRQLPFLHINDLQRIMPMVRNIASEINGCEKTDAGGFRNPDDFIGVGIFLRHKGSPFQTLRGSMLKSYLSIS